MPKAGGSSGGFIVGRCRRLSPRRSWPTLGSSQESVGAIAAFPSPSGTHARAVSCRERRNRLVKSNAIGGGHPMSVSRNLHGEGNFGHEEKNQTQNYNSLSGARIVAEAKNRMLHLSSLLVFKKRIQVPSLTNLPNPAIERTCQKPAAPSVALSSAGAAGFRPAAHGQR